MQPALEDPKFTLIPNKFGFVAFEGKVMQLGKVQFRRRRRYRRAMEIPLEQMKPTIAVKLVVQGELQNGRSPPSRPNRPQSGKLCDTPCDGIPHMAQCLLQIAEGTTAFVLGDCRGTLEHHPLKLGPVDALQELRKGAPTVAWAKT